MKKTMVIAAMAALSVALSGCGKKTQSPTADAPTGAASTADAMSGMAKPAGVRTGKATGIVTAIDATAGKITLDHGAIPAVGWAAMKMDFSAKPDLLKGISVGDKVNFEVTLTGSAGEVSNIKKQ